MLPDRRRALFVFDPTERALTDGNLLCDSGPHGLHCTPTGYVGPAWGIGTGPSGAQFISFDGATQYWSMPLDFYRYAPTTEVTCVVAARFANPGAADRIFDCVGVTIGILFNVDAAAAERIRLTVFDTPTACYVRPSANIPNTGRTRVIVATVRISTTMASGRMIWVDGQQIACGPAGTGTSITYDTAIVPIIGSRTGGGNYFDGDIYHLSAWPEAWSHSTAADMTAMLRDRE